MELGKLVEVLKSLAPLELAASWDNVGLLLQPSQKNHVSLIVLTIDLTEKVLDEIIRVKVPSPPTNPSIFLD
jgi:putative NIF3 family GTP cyclohydrolase 1 type 2